MKKTLKDWVVIVSGILKVMELNPEKMGDDQLFQFWNLLDYNLENSELVSYGDFKEALLFFHGA